MPGVWLQVNREVWNVFNPALSIAGNIRRSIRSRPAPSAAPRLLRSVLGSQGREPLAPRRPRLIALSPECKVSIPHNLTPATRLQASNSFTPRSQGRGWGKRGRTQTPQPRPEGAHLRPGGEIGTQRATHSFTMRRQNSSRHCVSFTEHLLCA